MGPYSVLLPIYRIEVLWKDNLFNMMNGKFTLFFQQVAAYFNMDSPSVDDYLR